MNRPIPLAKMLDDLPDDTITLNVVGNPGVDAWGMPCVMAVFSDRSARQRYIDQFYNKWIELPDRSARINYCFTWHDNQGFGLTLTTTR